MIDLRRRNDRGRPADEGGVVRLRPVGLQRIVLAARQPAMLGARRSSVNQENFR